MRYAILLAGAMLAVTAGALAAPGEPDEPVEPAADLAYSPETAARHVHLARDQAALRHGAGTTSASSAAMTFHGGNVLPHVAARVVLAGAKWRDPAFAADKVTGLDSFYAGYGGSSYAVTADEYIGANGPVGSALRYQGHAAPISTSVDGTKMSAVATAACAEFASGAFLAETGGTQHIAVYSDMKRPTGVKYCAYHGVVSCNRQVVTVAFYWNLDADAGCAAQDYVTGHTTGLAALANVTAHELHETRSDPLISAWYDAQQNEAGDKCAWTYASPYVTLKNGSRWKLQAEWSNAAYALSKGVANLSGQKACVDH
jgi:hypothetical protein